MRSIHPIKSAVAFAALGAAYHGIRVVRVELGWAQPHSIGSLGFPLTALIIISATATIGFIVGYGLGIAWNRLATAPVRTRAVWLIVSFVIVAPAGSIVWAAFLRPIKVQVAAIQHDVPIEVFGLGTVEARVTSKVGFKVSGVLVDLRADVGDRVAKGAVLARLDDREQSAQVARAKATIEQTEANLQRARASVEKAKANVANTKSINERRQKLVQTNVASVETAETAQAAQDAAVADLNLANSDVLVAEANISDAKALQQQQSATLDFHTLAAPYDAMVTARLKELGSALGAGEPVFTLIDPKSVWVLAYIDESKAGEIKVGEPAEIVLRSQPGQRIAGRVARIEPESDRVNEERRVEIAFDHIPANANLGEQAEVYITTVRLPQALLVPEAAIVGLSKNGGTVWTVETGHLQQHEVTLGHRLLDGRYEITGGLPANANVVAQLSSGLRIDRVVTITQGPGR
jgi:HlyD family secretion protein